MPTLSHLELQASLLATGLQSRGQSRIARVVRDIGRPQRAPWWILKGFDPQTNGWLLEAVCDRRVVSLVGVPLHCLAFWNWVLGRFPGVLLSCEACSNSVGCRVSRSTIGSVNWLWVVKPL